MIPINDDALPNDNNCFYWYKLNTKEDFEILIKAYRNGNLDEPEHFPTLYCVETCGYKPYEDESYSYDLATCKTCTEKFWEELGSPRSYLQRRNIKNLVEIEHLIE